EPTGLTDEHRELRPLARQLVDRVDHGLRALLWIGRCLERRRDLLGDTGSRGRETRLQQRVLVREVVQDRLLADPDFLRDRIERRPRVALGAELADGFLDDRGAPSLPTCSWHRSLPGARAAPARDRAR